jgi:hypothetical protein
MSVIKFKPSKFRIESLGPQLAYNQTYNPVNIGIYFRDIVTLEVMNI